MSVNNFLPTQTIGGKIGGPKSGGISTNQEKLLGFPPGYGGTFSRSELRCGVLRPYDYSDVGSALFYTV